MSLLDLTNAVAAQLEQRLAVAAPGIQVTALANRNPTPPAIDVYPADPFQEPDSFGPLNRQALLIVRGRRPAPSTASGKTLLLELMDPASPNSITAAWAAAASFAAPCPGSSVEGPS